MNTQAIALYYHASNKSGYPHTLPAVYSRRTAQRMPCVLKQQHNVSPSPSSSHHPSRRRHQRESSVVSTVKGPSQAQSHSQMRPFSSSTTHTSNLLRLAGRTRRAGPFVTMAAEQVTSMPVLLLLLLWLFLLLLLVLPLRCRLGHQLLESHEVALIIGIALGLCVKQCQRRSKRSVFSRSNSPLRTFLRQ